LKILGLSVGGCGFAGCAMGWAAHANLFEGLTVYRGGLFFNNRQCTVQGFQAASDLFQISTDTAEHFFSNTRYRGMKSPTPKHVANRIRKYVEKESNKLRSSAEVKKLMHDALNLTPEQISALNALSQ